MKIQDLKGKVEVEVKGPCLVSYVNQSFDQVTRVMPRTVPTNVACIFH